MWPPKRVGVHGQLEVHERAFVHAGERSSRPGFLRQVKRNRLPSDAHGSQAHAAHGNRIARFDFLDQVRGRNGEAPRPARFLYAGNLAHFFDNAGKHKKPPEAW